MQLYDVLALLTVLAAVFGYLNHRFLRLPDTIGVMLISLIVSLGILLLGFIKPTLFKQATDLIRGIDFYTILVRFMLGFLLFAGAIQINGNQLKKEGPYVLAFSTISVVISTAVIALLLYVLCYQLQQPIPFIYCLLFGALISPTDPIAGTVRCSTTTD